MHISLIKWCFITVYTHVKYLVVTLFHQTEIYYSYIIQIKFVGINICNVNIKLKPYVCQNSVKFLCYRIH